MPCGTWYHSRRTGANLKGEKDKPLQQIPYNYFVKGNQNTKQNKKIAPRLQKWEILGVHKRDDQKSETKELEEETGTLKGLRRHWNMQSI